MNQHSAQSTKGAQLVLIGKQKRRGGWRERKQESEKQREIVRKEKIKEENCRENKWNSDFITLLRLSFLLQIAKEPNLVISQHTHTYKWYYILVLSQQTKLQTT